MTISTVSRQKDQGLWLVRALYFCFFAAVGTMVPYLNLYFESIGLDGRQIGVLSSMMPFLTPLSTPFWGAVADRWRLHRRLLSLALLGAVLWVLAMAQTRTFAGLLIVMVGYALFASPVTPLMDSITMSVLAGHRERYGRQRLWGSLGFVLAAWGVGRVIQHTQRGMMFYAYVGLLGPALLLSLWLPIREVELRTPLRAGLNRLLRQRTWVIFLASLFLLCITIAGMNNFLSLYVVALGGGEELVGMAWALGALTEIPVMFLAPNLVRRLGLRRVLALAYLLYAVRWVLYAIMPAPEWVLAINLMHGLTFGALWTAGVSYADAMAPSGLKATAQGLFTATYWGLGSAIGAVVSGFLYAGVGPASMFAVYSVVALAALALFWFGTARG